MSLCSRCSNQAYNLFGLFIFIVTRVNSSSELLSNDDPIIKQFKLEIKKVSNRAKQGWWQWSDVNFGRPNNSLTDIWLPPQPQPAQQPPPSPLKQQRTVNLVRELQRMTCARRVSMNSMMNITTSNNVSEGSQEIISKISNVKLDTNHHSHNGTDCRLANYELQQTHEINERCMIIEFLVALCMWLKYLTWFKISELSDVPSIIDHTSLFDGLSVAAFGDTFALFESRAVLNFIASMMVLPIVIGRAKKIARRLRCKFGGRADRGRLELSDQSRKLHCKGINVVQLDLAYLAALRADTRTWLHLLGKSWFHHHELGSLEYERNVLTDSLEITHSEELRSIDCYTRMYAINIINFDPCYSNYFDKVDSDLLQHTSKRIYAKHQKEQQEPMPTFYIAKPIHRCDQSEMALLLGTLMLLYVLSFLTIGCQILCACIMELYPLEQSHITQVVSSISKLVPLIRWLEMFAWSIITILDTFDLFSYFACCLICLSRAKYMRLQLNMISIKCFSIRELLDNQEGSIDKRTFGGENEYSMNLGMRRYQLFDDQLAAFFNQDRTTCHYKPRDKYFLMELKALNEDIVFVIGLVRLIQRELNDLKHYFNLYLNLQVGIKPLCIAYAVIALMECKSNCQFLFMLSVTNHCITPIFIVVFTAAWVEAEFRRVCLELNRIVINGSSFIGGSTLKQIMSLSSFLSYRTNRSFVVAGYVSLTLGSLIPLFAWVATGVYLINRA